MVFPQEGQGVGFIGHASEWRSRNYSAGRQCGSSGLWVDGRSLLRSTAKKEQKSKSARSAGNITIG